MLKRRLASLKPGNGERVAVDANAYRDDFGWELD
jgi:hypothetical protein